MKRQGRGRASLFAFLPVMSALSVVFGCGQRAEPEDMVDVEIYMASKCERSAELVQEILPIARKLEGAVRIKVDYIGKEKNGAFYSLLGKAEIEGDLLLVCAAKTGGEEAALGFLKCMTRDVRAIPGSFEGCARSESLDAAKIESCSKSDEGKALLRESFERAWKKSIKSRPTVIISGKPYEGLFTEPSLGRALCNAIPRNKPAYCSNVPRPVEVSVTLINDKRCRDSSCGTRRILATISRTLEGAKIGKLDYFEPEGKTQFEKTGQKHLPVLVFSSDVRKDKKGFERLAGYLHPMEGSDDLVYPMGRTWDPVREICDNGVDDNGDGRVDCDDATCAHGRECLTEIKRKLTLFGMSECSYSARAVLAANELLKLFGMNKKKIDFGIEHVGKVNNGELLTLHGEEELDESLRQACAAKHYADGYEFMSYIACRAESFVENKGRENSGSDWTKCAKGKVKAETIRKCAEGDEGKELLSRSFELSESLEMNGAPRWLINNKYEVAVSSADELRVAFLEKNKGISECEKTLSKETTFKDYCGGRPKRKSE